MMTVDEALRHERDRLPFELEMVSIDAMETLAAEVRRQRREIEMLLEQRNDHMKGSADATTACIEYQQVIAELREENNILHEKHVRLHKEIVRLSGHLNKLDIEHKWAVGEAKRLTEENERLRKDAAIDATQGDSSQAQNGGVE